MFEVTARVKIREGQLEGFRRQAAEMMRLTRELDTRTLRYDWFLSDDGTKCEVREGYAEPDGLIEHAQNVFEAREKLFREYAYDHDMTLYGEPSAALAAFIDKLSRVVKFNRFTLLQGLESDIEVREEVPRMGSNRRVLDRYVERYNAGDLDGCMELYAEDAVQLMPDGFYEGRDAIGERLARELDAFPDIDWTVESFIEDGELFADEWTFVGTHAGPLPLPDGTELPATGKRVEIRGMEYVQMRDGKIVVDNLYYDTMAVAAQLGLLPAGAAA